MGIETLLFAGLGAASVASSLFAKTPSIPKPEIPATAADAARDSGATVRVGVRDEVKEDNGTGTESTFVEKRKQTKTVTGLGRGGLAI